MDNANEILIQPIREVWNSLTLEFKTLSSISNILKFTAQQPIHLSLLLRPLDEKHIQSNPELSKYLADSNILANEAFNIISHNKEALLYPLLVNAWAVIETSFDDLIIRLLINDMEASTKLSFHKIKDSKKHSIGSENWAIDIFNKIKRKASEDSKGFVYEYHKKCLSYFDINLEYNAEKTSVIEEINQIRNCILHCQGKIHKKAANICPRLNPLLGTKIPPDSPIFLDCISALGDYPLAWLAAIMFSPYLQNAMQEDAKNPFSVNC